MVLGARKAPSGGAMLVMFTEAPPTPPASGYTNKELRENRCGFSAMPLAIAPHLPPLPSPPGGTVLVRDCLEADAAFLLVQLIKAALAAEGSSGGGSGGVLAAAQGLPTPAAAAVPSGHTSQHCGRLVLVAVAQTASHYAAVLRKAGLSLPALVSAGRLALVELLPGLAAALPAESVLPTLRAVHARLAAAVTGSGSNSSSGSSSSSGAGVCLVVDDLTVSWE